jgi:hypothetical protein
VAVRGLLTIMPAGARRPGPVTPAGGYGHGPFKPPPCESGPSDDEDADFFCPGRVTVVIAPRPRISSDVKFVLFVCLSLEQGGSPPSPDSGPHPSRAR